MRIAAPATIPSARSRRYIAPLFVNNVTDAVYKIGGIPVYNTVGFASFFYGEPQMYGARLKYHW